jgi:lipoprotein-anchoring transpeptidase ErfK/SrfK
MTRPPLSRPHPNSCKAGRTSALVPGMRPLRIMAIVLVLLLTGGAAALGLSVFGQPERPVVTQPVPPPPDQRATIATAAAASVGIYDDPMAARPMRSLASPTEMGVALVLGVLDQRGEWLHVLLPVRPNGSTGWVRASQVTITRTDYSLEVSLAAHRLTLRQGDGVLLDAPVAVGTRRTPTPTGRFFVKEIVQPENPSGPYGAFALGLSAHSDVLTEFGGGDGTVAIHGTNQPGLIGQDVSHGCIRLSNADVTSLADLVPLGTPVEITA